MAPDSDVREVRGLRLFARELKERGKSRRAIVEALVEGGLDRNGAEAIADSLGIQEDSVVRWRQVRRGLRDIAIGALLCAAGFALSIATLEYMGRDFQNWADTDFGMLGIGAVFGALIMLEGLGQIIVALARR
jgi:hypothetical protein